MFSVFVSRLRKKERDLPLHTAVSFFFSFFSLLFFLLLFRFCIHLPQAVDQLLTDLQLALSVRLDDNVGCGLIFLTALAHQICDKRNGFVVLNQRSVVAVFDTV